MTQSSLVRVSETSAGRRAENLSAPEPTRLLNSSLMSAPGTKRQFAVTHQFGRYWRHSGDSASVASVMPTRLTNSDIGRFERDLLRRKAKTYEFGSDDDISGKSPILGCPPVVGFREGAARDLEGILLVRADWRDQVGEH